MPDLWAVDKEGIGILRYLSLGAGVQSTALLILSAGGKAPRADVAIFADTQDEPLWVYDHLEKLEAWSPIEIVRVTQGCISDDVIARHRGQRKRFAAIPAFTSNSDGSGGMLRRQCTREYKIEPIQRYVKTRMGYAKGQVVKEHAIAMIGISWDELDRMAPSRERWITKEYPLVDERLSRGQCADIIKSTGFTVPKKSSCVFCPYHSDAYWLDIKANYPQEWNRAVRIDIEIRDMSMSGIDRPIFLHRSLRPLTDVALRHENQMELFAEECAGVCGV